MIRATAHVPATALAAGLATAFVTGLLGLALAGCTASANQVAPGDDPTDCNDSDTTNCHRAKFFWPTGLAVSPDESMLFVANANSDLRYDTGAIHAVDLAAVETSLAPWLSAQTLGTSCSQDEDFTESMICRETQFILTHRGVQTGNFATAIGLQDKGNGDFRLVVPVRGDPSITWIDYPQADQRLECSDPTKGEFKLCDGPNVLTHLHNDGNDTAIFDEPFDVTVDSTNQWAAVSHLVSGSETLVDLPIAPGSTPSITDALTGLFNADSSGIIGAAAIGSRTPGTADNVIYMGSRAEDRIQQTTVVRPKDGPPALLELADFWFLNTLGGQSGGSVDTRGIAFDQGGDRMYVVNRLPPTLQVYDTSVDASGEPQHIGLNGTDICRDASRLTIVDSGDGPLVYLTCFDDGTVYVVDPRGDVQVTAVIAVGRGPYDIAASPSKHRLYVSNYDEDTVSVIDITPGSATRNRVVMRLGQPKPPGS